MSVKRVKTTKNYYLRAKQGGLVCGKLLKTTKNGDAPSKARRAGVLFRYPQASPPPSSMEGREGRLFEVWGWRCLNPVEIDESHA